MLIAKDEIAAKTELAGFVTAGGVNAIDAGALSGARELEAMGFLQLTLAAAEKIEWTSGFAVAEAPPRAIHPAKDDVGAPAPPSSSVVLRGQHAARLRLMR